MLVKIPILKKLRALEQKAGKDVTLKLFYAGNEKTKEEPQSKAKPSPKHDPKNRSRCELKQEHKLQHLCDGAEGSEGGTVEPKHSQSSISTLYLGGIPAGLRVSELKSALRERNVVPLRLTWQGAQHRAFLEYGDGPAADLALTALQDFYINGHTLQAERAKSQRSGHRPNQKLQRSRNKEVQVRAHTQTATTNTVNTVGPAIGGC